MTDCPARYYNEKYKSREVFDSRREGPEGPPRGAGPRTPEARAGLMNKRKLEKFRKLLNEELARLISEAAQTLNGMSQDKALFPDPTDRASLEADRNFLLRIRDRERKLILKIQEALARIDDGTFGICQQCKGEISETRLLARPVATLCVACKQLQEKEEKQFAH